MRFCRSVMGSVGTFTPRKTKGGNLRRGPEAQMPKRDESPWNSHLREFLPSTRHEPRLSGETVAQKHLIGQKSKVPEVRWIYRWLGRTGKMQALFGGRLQRFANQLPPAGRQVCTPSRRLAPSHRSNTPAGWSTSSRPRPP